MAKVYQEANGRFVYKTQESYNGINWECKGTSIKSPADAKKSWQKNRDKKIAEINGQVEVKQGRIKLSKLLPEWYDTYKRYESRGGRPRSARTIQTDEDTIAQICKTLGSKPICEIDSDVLQKYLMQLVRQGVSQSTIKKRWRMLSMYFDYVYPGDAANPMLKCKCPESTKKVKQWSIDDEDEETDKLAYTDAEMKTLAAELSKPYNVHSGWHTSDRGYSVGTALIVCMYEFLRAGELVELRVKDVRWDENMLFIRRQYDEYHKTVVPPKYGSRRKVPIAEECREIIQKACKDKRPEDLLFLSGTIYNPRKVTHEGRVLRGRLRDALDRACERTGVERHTIHDLRHDGISWIARKLPNDPYSVSKWAGHKSLSFTQDKYFRHTAQNNQASLEIVTGIVADCKKAVSV